jgi:hypothetical protein
MDITSIVDAAFSKSTSSKLRGFLNFVFTASITAALFQSIYFKYEVYDITDYKVIVDFFLTGNFFIPFILFLIIYRITYYIPNILFFLSNHFITKYLDKKLDPLFDTIIRSTDDFIISILELTKRIVDRHKEEVFSQYVLKLRKSQWDIEDGFVLYTRGLICAIIYYCKLPHFGGILFTTVIFLFVLSFFIRIVGYQLIHIIINYGKRLRIELDKKIIPVESSLRE